MKWNVEIEVVCEAETEDEAREIATQSAYAVRRSVGEVDDARVNHVNRARGGREVAELESDLATARRDRDAAIAEAERLTRELERERGQGHAGPVSSDFKDAMARSMRETNTPAQPATRRQDAGHAR